jgi:hypothetical protein
MLHDLIEDHSVKPVILDRNGPEIANIGRPPVFLFDQLKIRRLITAMREEIPVRL